ncbi:SURF1 family protein [Aliikangiella marina]|uniref:SURF1-like protein n=1 Tax=Aliikangiella marina TaxID=1712262 RepID=A0A545T968_9GAMM|nr:SURF1 family protein [Aliikangiella marina]TQV73760.1 SURF1 family protein [Aliikangiella marina]
MKYTIRYSFGRFEIRVNLWYLMIFLVLQTILNELGFWQLNRAKEKQYRIAQLERGSQTVVTDLSSLTQQQIDQFQSVDLITELVGYHILLLDNKIDNKRSGYHVLHVAKDNISGKQFLVNRGWIYAGQDRDKLPEIELPDQSWQVSARIYPIAEEVISTASAQIEESRDYIRLPVLDKKSLTEIESRLSVELEPYVLRLNESSEAALKTNWMWTNMPPEKHLAYAVQWFALALALLIVSLIVSFKRKGD